MSIQRKYIQRGWESYMKHVIPEDAPSIQVKETRQAFFSGAAILFTVLIRDLDAGEEPTVEDMQKMVDLQSEIDVFGQEIDADLLGIVRH